MESSAECQCDSLVSTGFPQPRLAWSQEGSCSQGQQPPLNRTPIRPAFSACCTPAPEPRHPPILHPLPCSPPSFTYQGSFPAALPCPCGRLSLLQPPPSAPSPGTVPALQKEPDLALANRPGAGGIWQQDLPPWSALLVLAVPVMICRGGRRWRSPRGRDVEGQVKEKRGFMSWRAPGVCWAHMPGT